jgi:hypothetical protein
MTCSLNHADAWMRPACKPDGARYYEYSFVYVDDLLILSHQMASGDLIGKNDSFKMAIAREKNE